MAIKVRFHEQRARGGGPVLRRRGTKGILARKMVKERAFGHARHSAQLIDGGGRKSLLADERYGRVQQLGTGIFRLGGQGATRVHLYNIPTSRYVVQMKSCGRG